MVSEALGQLYQRAEALGFLGPGEAARVIDRCQAYVAAVSAVLPTEAGDEQGGERRVRIADLGSGAGVPGLVVAAALPDVRLSLIDVHQRRLAFLRHAVSDLSMGERVDVIDADATTLGRDPSAREQFDVVVARSFRSPSVTAECASGLLRVGGTAFISEPPGQPQRWDDEMLGRLGLADGGVAGTAEPESGRAVGGGQLTLRCLIKRRPLGDEFPRSAASIERSRARSGPAPGDME